MLYPQNGDRIMAIVFVATLHPMYRERNVPKIIINDTINLFFKITISILVFPNHSSFRVLFDKKCLRVFYLKNIFIF